MRIRRRHIAAGVGLLGTLLASGVVFAGGPDPVNHTCPEWIYVVGMVDGGTRPDPFGRAVIVLRDFTNTPIPNLPVKLDFSAYCDVSLCGAVMNGVGVECTGSTVEGVTDAQGRLEFTVLGAGNQPGAPPSGQPPAGGGLLDVKISANGQPICSATAVCLDQNGASPDGPSGFNAADLGWLGTLIGNAQLTQTYRGRGDLNADRILSSGDLGVLATHIGRLALAGGTGCRTFCKAPACP